MGRAIFSYSASRVTRLRAELPDAVIGGTWNPNNTVTAEDVIGDHVGLDYSLWPDFTMSLGFGTEDPAVVALDVEVAAECLLAQGIAACALPSAPVNVTQPQ